MEREALFLRSKKAPKCEKVLLKLYQIQDFPEIGIAGRFKYLLVRVSRFFQFREEPLKSVLKTFLDHAEHEIHQLFERYFTILTEIQLWELSIP
ncbi:MAG: hypothetical protein LBK66_01900 [Spirochaetaceae bacterium]|nr:hypothetical protein [Spirochaetaceae bacterium]